MPAKIIKLVFIAALLLFLAVLWRSSSDYRTVLAAFVVRAGASVVFVQAAGAGKYVWAATFLAVGALFNPAHYASSRCVSLAGFGMPCDGSSLSGFIEDENATVHRLHYRPNAAKRVTVRL